MKSSIGAIGALTVTLAIVSATDAQYEFYVNDNRIGDPIGTAIFPDLQTGDPLQDYREAGLRIHVNDTFFSFNPCGFPDTHHYYPNGGVYEMIYITREDGEDIGAIEMNVSDGWSSCEVYMWIQAYLDGGLVAEFDADVFGGDLIGMSGGFDEVRIASYYIPETRDLHDPFEYNAISLDNVSYVGGSAVRLTISGSCPGQMNFDVSGATANATVAYVYARGLGNVVIPSGPCAGTELGLDATATLGGTVTADANGDATLVRNVPAAACGNFFIQALDVATCGPSNVEPI